MALNDIDTGHGATAVFTTAAYSFPVVSITPPEFSVEDIDTTDLSTTGFATTKPGDLPTIGDTTIEVLFDRSEIPTVGGDTDTLTITWPNQATTAANQAGSAYVKTFTPGPLVTNELQRATIIAKFDGETGPTFTAEADS